MKIKENVLGSLVQIAVTFYCLGILFFLVFANFAPKGLYNEWGWIYYTWEKIFGAGFVVWLAMWVNCSSEDKSRIAPVLFYSAIRIVWEGISAVFGVHINAPIVVAILFIIMIIICYVLTLREGNLADKWLSKILF